MYASIEKFDLTLMEAASDLGASLRRAFLRVMLPLTFPGVLAAIVLVFVPVVCAFITPDIMGGGKVEMIGTHQPSIRGGAELAVRVGDVTGFDGHGRCGGALLLPLL
jgi:ABC-type methionine transport system permease subunit